MEKLLRLELGPRSDGVRWASHFWQVHLTVSTGQTGEKGQDPSSHKQGNQVAPNTCHTALQPRISLAGLCAHQEHGRAGCPLGKHRSRHDHIPPQAGPRGHQACELCWGRGLKGEEALPQPCCASLLGDGTGHRAHVLQPDGEDVQHHADPGQGDRYGHSVCGEPSGRPPSLPTVGCHSKVLPPTCH